MLVINLGQKEDDGVTISIPPCAKAQQIRICLTTSDHNPHKVRVGFTAPANIRIDRNSVHVKRLAS